MLFDGKVAAVKRRGVDEEFYQCRVPWPAQPTLFQCSEDFYVLIFDETRLRFTFAKLFGYVDGSEDTIAVSYGDCQKS
jgi:hypothetical protein